MKKDISLDIPICENGVLACEVHHANLVILSICANCPETGVEPLAIPLLASRWFGIIDFDSCRWSCHRYNARNYERRSGSESPNNRLSRHRDRFCPLREHLYRSDANSCLRSLCGSSSFLFRHCQRYCSEYPRYLPRKGLKELPCTRILLGIIQQSKIVSMPRVDNF